MLVLRAAQIQSMADAARLPFHARVLEFIRTNLQSAVAGISDAELLQRIGIADRRAVGYGLKTERSITQFVCCTILVSPDFDQAPEVRRWLEMPVKDPDTRMDWYVAAMEAESKRRFGGPAKSSTPQ